ncbi:MAG: MFS transporter [Algicola sp.]|nr:MFS transporter [Algicola sp.]
MTPTFIITLVTLLLFTFGLRKIFKMPKNVCLLFMVQPLSFSSYPVMVFIGGILSSQIAPDPSLSTLPLTVIILSIGLASIPAALMAKKFGRRNATLIGFAISIVGSILAMFAALYSLFGLLVGASLCLGISLAFVQQLRFAAIESAVREDDTTKVLSALLFAGVFAAWLGPELVVVTRYWLGSPQGFAGTFLGLAIMVAIAMMLMSQFKDTSTQAGETYPEPRSMGVIAKQPIFIIAILTSVLGYSLMSYIMTATPISMHQIDGHSLGDTKWVIQSHISAMYLPSIFTPWLVKRLGLKNMLMTGVIIFAVVAMIALAGKELMHYWWALLLLGIGWNFLFLTGTLLLAQSYLPGENHKVQAVNDFLLFFTQGLFSLLAGWLLFVLDWNMVVYVSLPFMVILLMTSLAYYWLEREQGG